MEISRVQHEETNMKLLSTLRQIFTGENETANEAVCDICEAVEDAIPDIIQDMYSPVANQREMLAMVELDREVAQISASQSISRREAFCQLMAMDHVNCKERDQVEKFFWSKGVSDENITELTDEFYRLQALKFKGE